MLVRSSLPYSYATTMHARTRRVAYICILSHHNAFLMPLPISKPGLIRCYWSSHLTLLMLFCFCLVNKLHPFFAPLLTSFVSFSTFLYFDVSFNFYLTVKTEVTVPGPVHGPVHTTSPRSSNTAGALYNPTTRRKVTLLMGACPQDTFSHSSSCQSKSVHEATALPEHDLTN